MKLQQLRFFQAACRCNSITGAAKELHISQPSISAAIHSLEDEFGLKLIERKYQGFTLTQEGQMLLEMADGMLKHADKIEKRMIGIKSNHTPIRIGVSPMAGITILPDLYSTFLSVNPSILLLTEEGGTKIMLRGINENTLDIAFVSHYQPLPSEYATIPIAQTETMWCTTSNHPFSQREYLTIEDLRDESLVLFQSGFNLHDVVYDRFKAANITPNVLHETSQLTMIYALVKNGMASGFLMHSVASYFQDLVLIPMRPAFIATISLVWLPQRNMTADTKLLIDYYKSRASNQL